MIDYLKHTWHGLHEICIVVHVALVLGEVAHKLHVI